MINMKRIKEMQVSARSVIKYYYTVINGWESEGEVTEINLEDFEELLSDARDGFYKQRLMRKSFPHEYEMHFSPSSDNDWYVVHDPSPRQELNGVVYQDIVSNAGGSFHVRKAMLNRFPCEFIVHYSPPQELNGVVFEESKTIVIAKKSLHRSRSPQRSL